MLGDFHGSIVEFPCKLTEVLALVAFELRSAEVTESFLTQALQRFSVQFVPRELQHEEYGSDCVQIVVLNLPAPPC